MTQQARLLGGRYQLGELLGYGGMAEVHLGRDLRLGRDVAIKMLRVDLARDATFQARFRREAQNAASLNHPAIVAVYDTGEERGEEGVALPYIVMEYVNGRTLKEVLAAEGRIMPRRALEIVADTCAALNFSHRHGIIHRDIKPGNVMLTRSGQVKVMDFGIARALASGTSTMTATSAVIGTAQYLSPEQARGETVDARSDVYATGCVLYELMCGQPPFIGDNPVSVAYQHVREDPNPPSELSPEISPDVDAVVLKALAKNPANRYQNAGEMRADLLRAAAGRPVEATPVLSLEERTQLIGPPGRHADRPVARVSDEGRRRATNWALIAVAMLAVFALVALVTGLWLANAQPDIVVPDVRGMTVEKAVKTLEDKGLSPKDYNVWGGCDKGKITKQDPGYGEKVNEGTPVRIGVCQGYKTHKLPDVIGDDVADAKKALEKLNFNTQVEYVNAPVGTKDEVRRTDPEAGVKLAEEKTVKLFVSLGNTVKVPSVVGYNQDAAEDALTDAGFEVSVVTREAE
ncbi:MAG: Stk1 family PASTA domain-containing Ser/Thr kinase, partial [Micromonosporaceae bacterium]|nr:Stk1 family PASTA domain-containing Ser/Thr kinase [Micromonosporaceae bacterium]